MSTRASLDALRRLAPSDRILFVAFLSVFALVCVAWLQMGPGRGPFALGLALAGALAGVALLRAHHAELRRAEARGRAANLAQSRFLAAAGHDLRQPLHALGLFVEALAHRLRTEGAASADLASLAERVGRSAEHLRALIDDVLFVSSLDAGDLEPRPQAFRLEDLFLSLREELAPEARARGLLLRVAPTREVVRSDPALLGRMLRNLLVNAIRTTERGAVLLCARRRGAGVVVEVRDSGPGMDAAHQAAVFEEFHRLEAGRSAGDGLRLGLPIVARLGALLDHTVAVRSAPGRGSVFTVTAPRPDGAAARPVPQEGAAAADPLSAADPLAGRLYVVVDDDDAIRDGLAALLGGWGCRLVGASSPSELRALLLGLDAAPAALIVDDRLGGGETSLDALEVAHEVLGARPPAVLVTGETAPDRLAELRALGLPLLTKPVAPIRLRAVLASLT